MRSIDINTIFDKGTDNRYTSDCLLYQDIIHYSTISGTFRYTDLANWLIRNNKEMVSFYDSTSSKRNTPYNRRLHGQRRGIENKLHDLINLKLIYIVGPIKSEKNALDTELYSYTKSAHLLAWLIMVKDNEEVTKEISYGQKHFRVITKEELYYRTEVQHVQDIIDPSHHINSSPTILFTTKFLKKCSENGIFGDIITRFMTLTLPGSTVSSGGDLLSLFLGLGKTLHWFMSAPQLFRETITELDEETKKLILFRLKMEIEEFYNDNHHLSETFEQMYTEQPPECQYVVTVPGREWQEMRLNNISDYSKVTVPGFCGVCRSEQPYLVDISTYLDSILAAHGPYPCRGISDSCNKCAKEFGRSTSLWILPYLGAW